MKPSRSFAIVQLLASVGIGLALYLLWQQFFHPPFHPCSISATINCDAIISGAVSRTLGLPTPLYGLAGYSIIFIAARLHLKRLLLGTATFGLGFCLWIAYRELFELHVICPVCIACQVVMLTVFGIGVTLQRRHRIF